MRWRPARVGSGARATDRPSWGRSAAARRNLGPLWDSTELSASFRHPLVSSEEWLGVSDEEFDRRLVQLIRQNSGVLDEELARQLAAELTGGQQGEGDGQTQGSTADGGCQRPDRVRGLCGTNGQYGHAKFGGTRRELHLRPRP